MYLYYANKIERVWLVGPSHAPSPSYISLAQNRLNNASVSHGFFLNTHGFSAFDIGQTQSNKLYVSSPDPVYDYFLFSGPTPRAVINQFSEVVGGRISLPPKWAMGMKYDPAEQGSNQTFIEKIVQQFADRGIRPDRVVLEPVWQGPQYNWDTHKFGNITELINRIAPTKLILWEHPILLPSSDPHTALDGFYKSLVASKCLAAEKSVESEGSLSLPAPTQFSDLTLIRCQKLWKKYQLDHAIASGAVGFKLDEDDVDVDIGFKDSTIFPSGFKGYDFHNIQGYIWQRLYHEMFASLGRRTWLQSRGGYAGSQAYPTNSYSDGYDYTTYVLGVVNSGFSGLIWAPELRHATCGPNHTPEEHADFARRTQLMFLSPQAQYNAWDSKDGTTLWPTGGPGAASCGAEWIAMFKKHYDLRQGLSTYLYSAFETQSQTGIPVARALVIDSPEDQETWAIDDQFLLGDALMFAPAHAALDSTRKVYFPKTATAWHSWFNNTLVYEPGTRAIVPTPIMTAALFVKGGKPVVFHDSQETSLTILVWIPTVSTSICKKGISDYEWSSIYDDDGETTNYKIHDEHWRGVAGFANCFDGTIRLRFRVTHSLFETKRRNVVWTLRGVHRRAIVNCTSNSKHDWSLPDRELLISTELGEHECTVLFV